VLLQFFFKHPYCGLLFLPLYRWVWDVVQTEWIHQLSVSWVLASIMTESSLLCLEMQHEPRVADFVELFCSDFGQIVICLLSIPTVGREWM
jgi:hypothetical protein